VLARLHLYLIANLTRALAVAGGLTCVVSASSSRQLDRLIHVRFTVVAMLLRR